MDRPTQPGWRIPTDLPTPPPTYEDVMAPALELHDMSNDSPVTEQLITNHTNQPTINQSNTVTDQINTIYHPTTDQPNTYIEITPSNRPRDDSDSDDKSLSICLKVLACICGLIIAGVVAWNKGPRKPFHRY